MVDIGPNTLVLLKNLFECATVAWLAYLFYCFVNGKK